MKSINKEAYSFFKKTKMLKYLLIASILSLIFLWGPSQLRHDYLTDSEEFQNIALSFLSDKTIHHISIAKYHNAWNNINKWSFRPNTDEKWWRWDSGRSEKVFLNSLEEVLQHENISRETYEKYAAFIKKHSISSISNQTATILHMKRGTTGLRFMKNGYKAAQKEYETHYQNLQSEFKVGREYLSIEKINDQWYLYNRDSN